MIMHARAALRVGRMPPGPTFASVFDRQTLYIYNVWSHQLSRNQNEWRRRLLWSCGSSSIKVVKAAAEAQPPITSLLNCGVWSSEGMRAPGLDLCHHSTARPSCVLSNGLESDDYVDFFSCTERQQRPINPHRGQRQDRCLAEEEWYRTCH